MDKEIRELTKQRAIAESRVEDLLRMVGNDQSSSQWVRAYYCLISMKFRHPLMMPLHLLTFNLISFHDSDWN